MERILVRLLLLAAMVQFGFSSVIFDKCASVECVNPLLKTISKVIRIQWKPISIFPTEAKRFSSPYSY